MNKPRYILNHTAPIKIFENSGVMSSFFLVQSSHKKPIYIDILSHMEEGSCHPVKIIAYLNDGRTYVGYVVGFLIDIIHKDSLYDGRFNLYDNE